MWAPRVNGASEFSLSQIWVISGSFGDDLNTIEAGWQVGWDIMFIAVGFDKRKSFSHIYFDDAYLFPI